MEFWWPEPDEARPWPDVNFDDDDDLSQSQQSNLSQSLLPNESPRRNQDAISPILSAGSALASLAFSHGALPPAVLLPSQPKKRKRHEPIDMLSQHQQELGLWRATVANILVAGSQQLRREEGKEGKGLRLDTHHGCLGRVLKASSWKKEHQNSQEIPDFLVLGALSLAHRRRQASSEGIQLIEILVASNRILQVP